MTSLSATHHAPAPAPPARAPRAGPGSRLRGFLIGLAVAVVLLAWRALTLDNPGLAFVSDEAYADVLARSASSGSVDRESQVVIVRFDERTFQTLELPFQELSKPLSELIEKIRAGGPRVIGFDMGFGFLDESEAGRHFLDVAASRDDVVFTSQVPTVSEPVPGLPAPVRALARSRHIVSGFSNLNFPNERAMAAQNRGGVLRAVPLRHVRGGSTYHAFSLVLAARALGIDPAAVRLEEERALLGPHEVPLERGVLRFEDPGPSGFITVGLEAVLRGQIPAKLFRDRVVLVGSMYQPLGDHHTTAFGRTFGVHIQAAAVNTLLSDHPRRRIPWSAGLLVLATALAVCLVHARWPGRPALAFAWLVPLALHALMVVAYARGFLLPGAFGLLAGPATGLALSYFGGGTGRGAPLETTQGAGATAQGSSPAMNSDEDPVISVARASLGTRYVGPRLLGRGGMGVVLSAHDAERGHDVAVKIISPLLADQPNVIRRFLREIRALQQLTHPGIVRILDVHETARCPHYSMEIVRGTDLRQLLRAVKTLPVPRALEIFRQLFEVLAFVHDRGIVHRDIKPENILIADGDRLKLLDFGIAHLPEATAMTSEGQVLGTLRYMSPEQAEGIELTPASDVFTAALVAYEALTGRLPYPEVARVLSFTQAQIPLAELRPDAGPDICALMDQCLLAPRDRRPSTARHVLRRWPSEGPPEEEQLTI